MLISVGLPKVFWAEAVNTAAYLINRCPFTALNFKTPEEVWSRHPTDYTKIRVFGCSAYAHIRQNKLEPRALKCIFLGYPEGVKAYRLWCLEPGLRKCIISRDVVFNEHEMGNLVSKDERIRSQSEAGISTKKVNFEVKPEGTTQDDVAEVQGNSDWLEHERDDVADQGNLRDYNLTRDREKGL